MIVLAGFVAARGSALLGPFVLPLETAFQEAIALHHLENGFAANRFLPVMATIEGTEFFHTAHPPLLHVLYALLYKALGVHEWVTRGFSLLLYFSSVLLWRRMLGKDAAHAWMVFILAFALPLPFLLAVTTNYEPLSMFMVSLLGWLVLVRGARARVLAPVLSAGMLVDWPVYLGVPALLIVKWRDRPLRRRLAWLLAYEAVFLAALLSYQALVAGEAAVFSHAPERANPAALLDAGTWTELFSHMVELSGAPLLIVFAGAVAAWLAGTAFRRKAWRDDRERAGRESISYFAVLGLVLFLAAPRLVSRHYVHLMYFVPLMVLCIHYAVSRMANPVIALLALVALSCPRDYVSAMQRNPAYYAMAMELDRKDAGIENAFVSSAVGTWRYYAGIECVHPVSKAALEWVMGHKPELLHLEWRHGEVMPFLALVHEDRKDYNLVFSIPGEGVYARGDPSTGRCARVHVPCAQGHWERPCSVFTASPERAGGPGERRYVYAIRHHPGSKGTALIKELSIKNGSISVRPAIIHPLPFTRSDGVTFQAMAVYDKKKATRLLYTRFLQDRTGVPAAEAPLKQAREIKLMTQPGPRMDHSFDDAYWLRPCIRSAAEEKSHGKR